MVKIYTYIYVLVLLTAFSVGAYAQDTDGPTIFVEHRCYTCHTINAQESEVKAAMDAFAKSKGVPPKDIHEEKEPKGGDLSNVGAIRTKEWFTKFLKDPKPYFKDTPDCQDKARQKYRKRFKGPHEQFEKLVTYLTTLKYGNMQDKGFQQCLKKQ